MTGADHSKDPEDCRDTAVSVHAVMSHGVVVRDHVTIIQTAENTVEVSQVHNIGRIADVSAMMQRLVPTIQTAQTQRQVPVIQTVQRTAEASLVHHSDRDRGYPCLATDCGGTDC